MPKFFVIAFAAWLVILFQQPDASSAKPGEIRLCGRMLVQALSVVCNGMYNEPTVGKRDLARIETGSDYVPIWLLGMSRISEFHAQHTPFSTRQQRGIVDECCNNTCTVNVIRSYCKY